LLSDETSDTEISESESIREERINQRRHYENESGVTENSKNQNSMSGTKTLANGSAEEELVKHQQSYYSKMDGNTHSLNKSVVSLPEEDKETTRDSSPTCENTIKQQEPFRICSEFYSQQVEKMEKDLGCTMPSTSDPSTFDVYLSTLEKTLEKLNKVENEKMIQIAERMEAARKSMKSEDSEEEEGRSEEEFLSASSGGACTDDEGGDVEDEDDTAENYDDSVEHQSIKEASAVTEGQSTKRTFRDDRSISPELEADIKRILSCDLAAIEAINMERVMESIPRQENPDDLIINDLSEELS